MLPSGVGATLTSGNYALPMAKTPVAHSQQRMLEMMGPKEILQYEIEQEKDKITGKERKHREAMETQRKLH